MKPLIYSFLFLAIPAPVLAADTTTTVSTVDWNMNLLIGAFSLTLLVLLVVSIVLLRVIRVLSHELTNPVPLAELQAQFKLKQEAKLAAKKTWKQLFDKWLELRPISEEKDMIMEHQFDGIAELNNPTPGWFMGLFYATIVFGVVYIFSYHVMDWGKMQEEEYTIEMKQAEIAKKAFLAKSANAVDENTVKLKTDGGSLSSGAALFKQNCVACHGDKGQGIVGPNLTDKFWIHGGKINNVFKTIKYGVPEKGMISWEKTLTPKQIADVSNYILSLQGTNPPNPKAPQGTEEI
ncbi:MAG: cbb3-type cytochrome c oxidase N-terminal domain-containing protein [Sphingobacteriaceae bacterium]